MNFDNYEQKKKDIFLHLNSIKEIATKYKISTVISDIDEDLKNLNCEDFTIVVVGEFSRGKSTFVNAMLGNSILPSSKKPTTNVISKIVYKDVPEYKLIMKNGQVKIVDKSAFDDIKAQSDKDRSLFEKAKNLAGYFKKEEDFSNIRYAEIGYPLSFCKNNVNVVDTPGTNDLNVGRMEITYEYLKQADAAILVLSATQALSNSEKQFLKEYVIGNGIRDTFVVVNFKDVLEGNEEQEVKVKEYVLKHLSDLNDFASRIFLVSSRGALLYRKLENGEILKPRQMMDLPKNFSDTGFEAFEDALTYFLSVEKGNSKLNKYLEKIPKYVDNIESVINQNLEAISHSTDEVREKIRIQRPLVLQAKKDSKVIIGRLRNALFNIENNLGSEASLFAGRMVSAATSSIDSYSDGMNEKDVQYLVEKAVTPIQKNFIERINDIQNDSVKRECNYAVNQLKSIWNNLKFDMKLLPISTKFYALGNIDVTEEVSTRRKNRTEHRITEGLKGMGAAGLVMAAIGFHFFSLFTIGCGILSAMASDDDKVEYETIRTSPKEKIRRQVREFYEKSTSNLKNSVVSQYHNSIVSMCDEFDNDITSRLNEMDRQLEDLLTIKEKSVEESAVQRTWLEQDAIELRRIRSVILG